MTTLIYKDYEYNVVYVDPSITSEGDGTTYDKALVNIPTTLVDNTCYLIRRTPKEVYTQTTAATNTSITHIMFMGMPKETDEEYDLITDESVKTAWGSDDAEYANVMGNALILNYIRELSLTRCFFFRNTSSTSATNTGPNPMFLREDVTGNDTFKQDVSVYVNHCKFGHYTFDMGNEEYRNSTETVSGYYYYCKRYLILNTIGNFVMKNTQVDYSSYIGSLMLNSSCSSSTYQPLLNTTVRYNQAIYVTCISGSVCLKNNLFNTLYSKDTCVSYYSSSSTAFYYPRLLSNPSANVTYTVNGSNVIRLCSPISSVQISLQNSKLFACNNTINNILYSDFWLPSQTLYISNTLDNMNPYFNSDATNQYQYNGTCHWANIEVYQVNINTTRFKNAKPSSNFNYKIFKKTYDTINYYGNHGDNLSKYLSNIYIHGFFSGLINGINVNNDDIYASTSLTIDNIDFGNATVTKSLFKISNFKAKYSQNKNDSIFFYDNYMDCPVISIRNKEIINYGSNNTNYHDYINVRPTSRPILLENIDIDCPLATALDLQNTKLKNVKARGKVNIGFRVSGTINKLVNCDLRNPALNIYSQDNDISVEELQVDYDNSFNSSIGSPQVSFDSSLSDYYGNSKIRIGASNAICFKESTNSSVDFLDLGTVVCPNHGKQGQFIQMCPMGKISSCSVYRNDSSATASLKFELNGDIGTGYYQTIGSNDYDTILLTPTEIGEKIITAFVYTENNISDKNIKDMFIIDLQQTGDNTSEEVFSDANSSVIGIVSEDTSTWSNIENGYAKKIEIPFNVISLENPIELNIRNGIGNNGNIYFDPDIKII